MIDYITNNQLYVDKSTYIAIVSSQIAIYGILITFYQFLVSFQYNQNSTGTYLSIDLKEYIIKKIILKFNFIIYNRFFYTFIIAEILYKPILNIFGSYFPKKLICFFNFLWYGFIILFFTMFIIFFYKCIQATLSLKKMFSPQVEKLVICKIDKIFIKKTLNRTKKPKNIEWLRENIELLGYLIRKDNNFEFQSNYNNLVTKIFEEYISNKKIKIAKIIKNKKNLQMKLLYDSNNEFVLLRDIIDEKYFPIDEELKKSICKIHLDLLKLSIKIANLGEYNYIKKDNFYKKLTFINENNITLEFTNSVKFTIDILKKFNMDNKKWLISELYCGYIDDEIMFKTYCKRCSFDIIYQEIENLFSKDKPQKFQDEFIEVFKELIQINEINDYYTKIVSNNLRCYNDFNAVKIVKLLSKENSKYLFAYLIIYHSIYKFRFDWKYINIDVIKELWYNCKDINENKERIIKKFEQSDIKHRFSKNMYIKLIEYIKGRLTNSLFNTIYTDNILDIFYVTIIKLCVIEQYYYDYEGSYKNNPLVIFINRLSNYTELIQHKNVERMLFLIQYKYFGELKYIPENLNISLRSLLLTNINIIPENLLPQYNLYTKDIGAYLLTRLSQVDKENIIIKDLIRKAYIEKNKSIDEYIDLLDKECKLCLYNLDYVQKEKMKEYLLNIL